ncbi:hypothetical protein D3C73_1123510 [compost metagenome]
MFLAVHFQNIAFISGLVFECSVDFDLRVIFRRSKCFCRCAHGCAHTARYYGHYILFLIHPEVRSRQQVQRRGGNIDMSFPQSSLAFQYGSVAIIKDKLAAGFDHCTAAVTNYS